MLTIAKFVVNHNKDSTNHLISRTLGKLGVLDSETVKELPEDQKPRPGDFWYCTVVRETKAGTGKGLFVLAPHTRVGRIVRDGYRQSDISHLIPGHYDTEHVHNVLLLRPKQLGSLETGPHWICPQGMRHHLMVRYNPKGNDAEYQVSSIMVAHAGDADWIRHYE